MQAISLNIEASTFSAVSLFSAKKDILYYLNGVMVETCEKGAYLVATNGHVLCVHQIDDIPRPDCQIIISNATAEQIAKKKKGTLTIHLGDKFGKYSGELRKIEIVDPSGSSMLTNEQEGIFPDWRRVAKHETNLENHTFYDPDYVAMIDKAGKIIKGSKETTFIMPGQESGCGFAVLDYDGKTCVWVMPMRTENVEASKVLPSITI